MKQVILVLLVSLVLGTVCCAQSTNDSIKMQKVFGGVKLIHQGGYISLDQAMVLAKENQIAYDYLKSGKGMNILGTIVGGAGGFMIGFPLGTAIAGGDANWTLVGIGVAVVGISIPIAINANKKIKKGVEAYNSELLSRIDHRSLQFALKVDSGGLGIALKF